MSFLPSFVKRKTIVLVTGMGTMYQKGGALKTILLSSIKLYREYSHFVAQNSDDLEILKGLGCEVSIFRGSGVQWRDYRGARADDKINFLLGTRLLKTKGVMDYVRAAQIVLGKTEKANFFIVGDYDANNLASISKEELKEIVSSDCKYLGYMSNSQLLTFIEKEVDYSVLPSEREGMSKFLLESISIGVPVITCLTPGGRDLVDLGLAFGVEYGNVGELASLFERLIENATFKDIPKISQSLHSTVSREFSVEQYKKFIIDLI